MRQERREGVRVHRTARGQCPVCVEGLPGLAHAPSVDETIGRPGIKRNRICRFCQPGDIGHAAQIENRQGLVQTRPRRKGIMIKRRQRGALPPLRHVLAAKIEHDINPGRPGQRLAIADLARAALAARRRRPVQHGLAVKPDQIDLCRRQASRVQNARHSLCMPGRQDGFGVCIVRLVAFKTPF